MGPMATLVSTGVPSVAVLGLLAWVVIRVMRQSGADRRSYDEQLSALTSRYDEAIKDLREQIANFRAELREVKLELEQERKARHEAEDELAKYRRMTHEPPR